MLKGAGKITQLVKEGYGLSVLLRKGFASVPCDRGSNCWSRDEHCESKTADVNEGEKGKHGL